MKTIIITGGKGYLGSSITRTLSNNGFNVVEERFDVTDESVVEVYAEEVKNKFRNIFALIHTASSPLHRKQILEESKDDFEKQFKTNVFGAFYLFKHFFPLISPGGAIIGILSKSIERGITHASATGSYIPAKYALRGLLRVLGEEFHKQGVRVYGVSPAFMVGGLNKDIPRTVSELIVKKSSPEDITTGEEVAKIILDLVNDEKGNMHGKSVIIPGGDLVDL